jgi:hypothetical protein
VVGGRGNNPPQRGPTPGVGGDCQAGGPVVMAPMTGLSLSIDPPRHLCWRHHQPVYALPDEREHEHHGRLCELQREADLAGERARGT